MKLEDEFTLALKGTIKAAKAHGYTPNFFMGMLREHGSVETAKRLLANSEPQIGLQKLWNLGILHESMEAVIWDNPEFHQLFTSQEIDEVHRRLEELNYFKKGK